MVLIGSLLHIVSLKMRKIKKYISIFGRSCVTPNMLATILGYLAWTCKLKLLTYTYKSTRYSLSKILHSPIYVMNSCLMVTATITNV